MLSFELSEFGTKSLIQSPVNSMTESFAKDFREGIDINLGVGYVNDNTIPALTLQTCFAEVISQPQIYKNPLNYGAAHGSNNLKKAIQSYYAEHAIGGFTKEDFTNKEIIIGANGATSILEAISDVMPKGIVFTADPMYYIYIETLERKGFTVIAIPEDEQGVCVDILRKKVAEIAISDISYFYFITINNPSTIQLSNKRKKQIVQIAEEISISRGSLLPVIFDKAYEDIIYDETLEEPISALKYDTLGVVLEVGTLSKIIAPALRIGYAIAHKSDLVTALIQKASDIGFSAPLINQEIAACFLTQYMNTHKSKVLEGYKEKAMFVNDLIQTHISPFLSAVSGGKAAFYYYLTFTSIETHSESKFFRYLSRTTGVSNIDGVQEKNPRLIYVPGDFCVHAHGSIKELGKRQLRISFGFEENQKLEEAIVLIKDAAEYALSNK